MSRVLLLAEGQTEESFVKKVLAPHLLRFGVYLVPTIVETKVLASGRRLKGGGDFSKLNRNMRKLFQDTDAAAITMFYDYYAFPQNFPSDFTMREIVEGQGVVGADKLEQALTAHFNHQRFKSFIHLHEFEAFMFVNANITAANLLDRSIAPKIAAQRSAYTNAEAINDGVDSAPSKRIANLAPRFQKLSQGVIIAEQVGLPALRADCPRFSAWMTWLENLGDTR